MKLFGLDLTFTRAAFYWHLGLALLSAGLAYWLLGLDPGALTAGALSALVFFVSELLHQLGHAWAARRTGYPMTGIHFFSLFAGSVYPADEPPLPRQVHIQRSLGGFWVNVVIGLLLVPFAVAAWPAGGVGAWLLAFGVVANLFVLGLGALVPLRVPGGDGGVSDGGALLRYWREAQAEKING
jgi:Zn-dependent protease